MMTKARTQVLGDGQEFTTGVHEVPDGLRYLSAVFPHSENEVRLRDQPGLARRRDDPEGSLVAKRWSDSAKDSGDCFDVVCQHFGRRSKDPCQQVRLTGEVRDQQLNAGSGVLGMYRANSLGIKPSPLVFKVVTGNTGDGGITQTHRLDALRDAHGFLRIQSLRLPRVDLAEVTPPGALVSANEEGGFAILPALVDVGAPRFLAHRVESLVGHELAYLAVLGAGAQPCLDPRWFSFNRGLGVPHLKAEQPAALGSDRHDADLSRVGAVDDSSSNRWSRDSTTGSTSETATVCPTS